MLTLFELQTQSGQLWTDIVAHLDAKQVACDEAIASKDAEIAFLKLPPKEQQLAELAEKLVELDAQLAAVEAEKVDVQAKKEKLEK